MATIFIPAQLKELSSGIGHVDVAADNVGEAIRQLDARFPGIKQRLCTGDELKPGLQVSIDGKMSSRGVLAKIDVAREVHFLPVIGGG